MVLIPDKFSPYLDPEPIAEFFDDLGQRWATTLACTIAIHIGILLMFQSQFDLPEIEEEPETISVEIVSFEPEQEAEPEPEPVLRPAVPAPAQAPRPKPKPKPRPEPTPPPPPLPPPPAPEPEPIPEPDPVVIPPPPPEIIQSPDPEPNLVPEPIPEPVIQPQPEPQPQIEIFEPAPIIQPEPEPVIQPRIEIFEPQPVQQPEPLLDPIIQPDPEPLPEPIIEPEPVIEPEPIIEPTPEPIIEPDPEPLPDLPDVPTVNEEEAISGTLTEEIVTEPLPPEPVVIDTLPEPVVEPEPQTRPAPEPTPEVKEPDSPAIITTAPTILASPDAPTTQSEQENAIPQSQASPLDFILKDRNPGGSSGGRQPADRPGSGGGGNTGQVPIAGGTRAPAPGAGGWQLAPGSYGNEPGEGYKGLVLDIRCREAKRTHADCPEYLRKYEGRKSNGFENFGAHAPRGTTITNRPTRAPGTSSIFDGSTAYGGPSSRPGARATGGPTDDNSGGPSTSVLDDVYLPQYGAGTVIPDGASQGGRVRDVFGNSDPAPWTLPEKLPETPQEEEDGLESIILRKDPN